MENVGIYDHCHFLSFFNNNDADDIAAPFAKYLKEIWWKLEEKIWLCCHFNALCHCAIVLLCQCAANFLNVCRRYYF